MSGGTASNSPSVVSGWVKAASVTMAVVTLSNVVSNRVSTPGYVGPLVSGAIGVVSVSSVVTRV